MTTKNKKGFTIIEVVLVLAIAGLIFLMVFIALPALQRTQRNTQREDDMARVISAINDFQTNNNGKTPFNVTMDTSTLKNFVTRYLDSECTGNQTSASLTNFTSCGAQFLDPDGQPYQIKYVGEVGTGSGKVAAGDITSKLKKDTNATAATFDHVFYGFTNAGCGDEGAVVAGTGVRQVAIFFVEEGGAIACNDNH